MLPRTAKFLTVLVAIGVHLSSAADDLPQSHCRPGEYVYLNAKLDYDYVDGVAQKLANPGVLSICSYQDREPIRGLSIRYGRVGAPLQEYRATPLKKISAYVAQTGPSMGRNVLSWSSGSRTYCVTVGEGLEHGVVFYSVDERGAVTSYGGSDEYEHGSVEIDFDRRMSPIFVRKRSSCHLP